jgi:ABC-type transport system substrate-binding protein
MLGYYDGKDNPHYSPKQARAQLAQCPGRTLPFDLKFNHDNPAFINEFPFIARELQAIGMDVRLVPLTGPEYQAAQRQPLDQAGPRLLQYTWVQDYPDPQDYLFFLLHSEAVANFGDWHNARYDRLVDRADAISSRKERAKLYVQAQHIALNQGAIITLTQLSGYKLIKTYVHGLVATEAYYYLVPRDGDWSRVSIGTH